MKSGRLPVTENMNGLSIGVSPARPLPGELPFFYEYGVDAMAVFGDHNSTLVSAIVPVSLMYQLDLGQVQLLPFAGLNLTAHILGQSKYEGVTSDWFKSDNGDSAAQPLPALRPVRRQGRLQQVLPGIRLPPVPDQPRRPHQPKSHQRLVRLHVLSKPKISLVLFRIA